MLVQTRSDPDFERKLKSLSSVLGKKKTVVKPTSEAIEEIHSGSDRSSDGDEELRDKVNK